MKRQPSGTPVGGQFAQDRKPEGADLAAAEIQDFNYDENSMRTATSGLKKVGRNYEYKGHLIEHNRGIGAWKCNINLGNDRYIHEEWDTLKEAKFALDNLKFDDAVKRSVPNHETGTFNLGDHTYQFEKTGPENDITEYILVNDEGGGGWRFKYDSLTCRALAVGFRPRNPSAEWRDKGEADIRAVVRLFEPNAKLVALGGDTYLIGGDQWPLSKSHLSGINSGQMMLTGGKSEDDLREYVAQQRSDIDRSESERPDASASFAETRHYIDGIEIAADLGSAAAEANTVGAMNARFGNMTR